MQAQPPRLRSATVVCAALFAVAFTYPAAAADATVRARVSAPAPMRLPPQISRVEVLPTRELRMTLPTELMRDYRVSDEVLRRIQLAALPDGGATVTASGVDEIPLVPRSQAAGEATVLGQGRVSLPVVYLNLRGVGEGRSPVDGWVFVEAARSPMVWDAAISDYATDVFIGYDYRDGRSVDFGSARSVRLLAEGEDTRVEPLTVSITRSGTDGAKLVKVRTRAREGTVRVVVRETQENEKPVLIPVAAQLDRLELAVNPSRIEAFGLGSGVLAVRLIARDQLQMPPAAVTSPVPLAFDAPLLAVAGTAEIAAGAAQVEVPFKSWGLGEGEVRVSTGGRAATARFEVVFPWVSLIAVVTGGLLGGAARWMKKKQPRRFLGRRLTEGVTVALILVAALWAGLVAAELAGLLTTPVAGFALAALAAYVGTTMLDHVAGRVLKPLGPAVGGG